MGTYDLLPNGDDHNHGWTLVGSGVTKLWQAWDDDDDATYAKCPSSKGIASVSFPNDVSTANIPEGAVITSVTVLVRANRTGSTARSLTVQLLSDEHHHHHHYWRDDDEDDD